MWRRERRDAIRNPCTTSAVDGTSAILVQRNARSSKVRLTNAKVRVCVCVCVCLMLLRASRELDLTGIIQPRDVIMLARPSTSR